MKIDNRNTFRVTSIFVEIVYKNNDNLLQHPREKIDPLIGIQDFVPKVSCFTPDNRKTFEILEKSS